MALTMFCVFFFFFISFWRIGTWLNFLFSMLLEHILSQNLSFTRKYFSCLLIITSWAMTSQINQPKADWRLSDAFNSSLFTRIMLPCICFVISIIAVICVSMIWWRRTGSGQKLSSKKILNFLDSLKVKH